MDENEKQNSRYSANPLPAFSYFLVGETRPALSEATHLKRSSALGLKL